MANPLFKKLLQQALITDQELQNVQQQSEAPVNVHGEALTFLYAGIVLLTSGLGVLVYKNIDSIGHLAVIAFIGICCMGCFAWAIKKGKGYAPGKVQAPGVLYDYVVLLGCLLLLIWVGYLQFAYQVFGQRWGMASFIPMVLLFGAAYYFDHLGVLGMAVANLATWAGITVAPLNVLSDNDFTNTHLIYTALVLGGVLTSLAFAVRRGTIKQHFYPVYLNFGVHILFVGLLCALFELEDMYLLFFIATCAAGYLLYLYARKAQSYYYLVITLLYSYTALTYAFIRLLLVTLHADIGGIYLSLIYLILSGIGLVKLLLHYNKLFKQHARVQAQ